jgi:hypothetical protein
VAIVAVEDEDPIALALDKRLRRLAEVFKPFQGYFAISPTLLANPDRNLRVQSIRDPAVLNPLALKYHEGREYVA